MASPARPETWLRKLLSRQYADLFGNKRACLLLRLLVAESRQFPELAEIYYREIVLSGISAIELAIQKGIVSGEFQATDVGCFPQILAAPTILAVAWILLLGKRHTLDIDAYRQTHLDFVLAGPQRVDLKKTQNSPQSINPGEES